MKNPHRGCVLCPMIISTRLSALPMLLLGVFAFGCGAGHTPTVVMADRAPGISVTGRGEARAAPDLAILDVGVEARRPTVAEARTAAATAQRAVLDALTAAGIEDRDVRTTSVSVQPDYDYSESGRRLLGYVVSNSVEARIRDLDAVQPAIDTAVAAGGDLTRLNGLRFELSEPEAVRREARARGIANARAEAEQIAQELGVRLGEPLSVEEGERAPIQPMMMRMEAAQADQAQATPIQPGETEVTVEVRVRWAIER